MRKKNLIDTQIYSPKQKTNSNTKLNVEQARETRNRLKLFEEDWNAPGMEAYDNDDEEEPNQKEKIRGKYKNLPTSSEDYSEEKIQSALPPLITKSEKEGRILAEIQKYGDQCYRDGLLYGLRIAEQIKDSLLAKSSRTRKEIYQWAEELISSLKKEG